MNTETKRLLPDDIHHRLQRKGRALSAARLGLKNAIVDLETAHRFEEASEAQRALKRSYRMENEPRGFEADTEGHGRTAAEGNLGGRLQ